MARRMANELGVGLESVVGTGLGGRIVKADIERAFAPGSASPDHPLPPLSGDPSASSPVQAGIASPETAKGTVEIVELSKLQQTVSRRMAESKATAPHFYLQAEIDMSAAWDARSRIKASAPEGAVIPSFNDMVVKACAIALREFPRANGAYRDGKWELYSRVNIGIAVAAPGRAGGADDLRRRSEGTAPDRVGIAGARGTGPRGARSPLPNSPAAPSPSPTSACTGWPSLDLSSTRRRPPSSGSVRSRRRRWRARARSPPRG